MNLQNYEKKNAAIRKDFLALKQQHPERLESRLNLCWSNWGFGMEPLAASAARLEKHGIRFIELHGNHYGPDLGYRPGRDAAHARATTASRSPASAACSRPTTTCRATGRCARQAAIDYLKRELAFAADVEAGYLLVVPGAVGRPNAYDDAEFERSVETLRLVADLLRRSTASRRPSSRSARRRSASATPSPTPSATSPPWTTPAWPHINGDVYHMQAEEPHIGEAILEAGRHADQPAHGGQQPLRAGRRLARPGHASSWRCT